jgi:hypothetical protein
VLIRTITPLRELWWVQSNGTIFISRGSLLQWRLVRQRMAKKSLGIDSEAGTPLRALW